MSEKNTNSCPRNRSNCHTCPNCCDSNVSSKTTHDALENYACPNCCDTNDNSKTTTKEEEKICDVQTNIDNLHTSESSGQIANNNLELARNERHQTDNSNLSSDKDEPEHICSQNFPLNKTPGQILKLVSSKPFESYALKSSLSSIEKLIEKRLLTPCKTCVLETDAHRNVSLTASNVQKICDSCSHLITTVEPSKISVSTSSDKFDSYVLAIVKENIKSILEETNVGCSGCPAKSRAAEPIEKICNKPNDTEIVTSVIQVNDQSILTEAIQTTDTGAPDSKVEMGSKEPLTWDLGREATVCAVSTCPVGISDTCTCHYPPAFNRIQCSGKITGTCDCVNKLGSEQD